MYMYSTYTCFCDNQANVIVIMKVKMKVLVIVLANVGPEERTNGNSKVGTLGRRMRGCG